MPDRRVAGRARPHALLQAVALGALLAGCAPDPALHVTLKGRTVAVPRPAGFVDITEVVRQGQRRAGAAPGWMAEMRAMLVSREDFARSGFAGGADAQFRLMAVVKDPAFGTADAGRNQAVLDTMRTVLRSEGIRGDSAVALRILSAVERWGRGDHAELDPPPALGAAGHYLVATEDLGSRGLARCVVGATRSDRESPCMITGEADLLVRGRLLRLTVYQRGAFSLAAIDSVRTRVREWAAGVARANP